MRVAIQDGEARVIYILYGGDEVSLEETLASLKEDVGPPELRDANITTFSGAGLGLDELTATCDTVPFLTEKRMVVVRGLLTTFERRGDGDSSSRKSRSIGEWRGLADYLPGMPGTTDLVFVDSALDNSNPLLSGLRPLADVRTFPMPAGRGLRGWIVQRAASKGVDIEPRAVDALADSIGSNPRVIDGELQKLSTYRWRQTIRRQDVDEMVAYVKDANIFAAVDAALEGRTGAAARLTHQLLESGRAPTYIIAMIARQVRLLILAKDLKARNTPADEIGRKLSLSSYPLQKTLAQEQKLSGRRLVQIHRKLLEADLSIKTSQVSDEVALDILVAELAPDA